MISNETPAPEPSLTRWGKARMVIKVIELRLRFVALMAATGLVFGYWDTIWGTYEKWSRPAGVAVSATEGSEFYCPMHPTVVRETSGSCPICGMPLSKRKAGEAEALPPGAITRLSLSPFRVAQAGIRTAEVGYEPLAETLTTVGTIEVDERRLARISSKSKGIARVESLAVDFTGVEVKAGQPLAELYSPELYQAVQELLLANRRASGGRAGSLLGDPEAMVRMGREKLALWGLDSSQVDRLLASGKADARLPILAPFGGVVMRKNIVLGQYVNEGDALFDLADLSRVWALARVYEDRIGTVRVGQKVEAEVVAFPGETFEGEVAFIDPALDPLTRTVGVRYDLQNPDGRLRPGMFATVTLRASVADSPAFRSRVAARSAGPATQTVCPVTSLKLGAMGEPVSAEVQGRKVLMCCSSCEPKLRATPAVYLARLNPAPAGEVLSVPESAVVDTGGRKVVYVETAPGVFEGRAVVLGPRSGDRYPVLDGLAVGEKVAAAGAFLIDAETRLNPAAAGGPPTPPAPKPAPAPAPRSARASDDGRVRR